MVAPQLEKMLALQACDAKRLELQRQLEAVPRDVAAVEGRIASERQAIEAAKAEWRELETRKKSLETEIRSAEEQVARYRTQQMQVRKNDEYQALTHEIETTSGQIGTLEEDEIRVMFSIDEAKQRFAEAESRLKANIAGYEEKIRVLREREAVLTAEHAAAVSAAAAARPAVPADLLRIYDRLAAKPGFPAVVPVSGGRCGGCHLKVPTHIEVLARSGTEIATCDQCGRVVYWAS